MLLKREGYEMDQSYWYTMINVNLYIEIGL